MWDAAPPKTTIRGRGSNRRADHVLLADSAVRPRWINIHSHHDIISGGLQYFDSALTPHKARVQNLIDPDARVPFAAHVEFWDNRMLWDEVLKAI